MTTEYVIAGLVGAAVGAIAGVLILLAWIMGEWRWRYG